MKPRIVFVKTPDPRGIVDTLTEGLQKSLSARNFEVKVVEPTQENIQQIVNEIIEYRPLFTFDFNLDGLIFAEKDNQQKILADIIGNIHVSWFLDDPMIHFTKLKSALKSNQLLYLTIDIEHGQWLGSMGKNVAFLAPGINPADFPPPNVEKEFDLAFVGPVTDPDNIELAWKERFDEGLFGFAVELGRMLYRNPDMPVRYASGYLLSQYNQDFQQAMIKFQQEREDEFLQYLTEITIYAMHLRRWNIIDSIEDFEINVLGPVEGETKDNVVVYKHIISNKDIISFLSKTKIALLSHPPFIPTGLAYTVFASVASNTLTMVEERLSSKTFLVDGRDLVTYHPVDSIEIEGKIAYYLEEAPKEREMIAKQGRDTVFQNHTILQRGEFLANMLNDIIEKASQSEGNGKAPEEKLN
ncbi:glycosyltransferase family 1 protein [Persephonella atlantica]|uniref:Glycosyltransferase family 1 protein n=1 Tax=Persephonella atlantica TaxID=2699429 RepID=A0ABS1GIJ2_9AQUI|nr:glycosyltransferase [Persephonella atlantica]MBK3332725.1 glycosyltransferase family 1 protein [Persephonella atlantica]